MKRAIREGVQRHRSLQNAGVVVNICGRRRGRRPSSSSNLNRGFGSSPTDPTTAGSPTIVGANNGSPAAAANGGSMMWERVVPASARMLEFLGLEPGATTSVSRPSSLSSGLQLTRFYLGRGDLKSAKTLLSSLQDGNKASAPVAPALLRPLFQMLIEALCRAGEAEAAMDTSQRITRAGQPLSKEALVALLECCRKGSKGPRPDLANSILQNLSEPDAWKREPEACVALLELLAEAGGRNNNKEVLTVLPSVSDVWTALTVHCEMPSLRAHVAFVRGLAAGLDAPGSEESTTHLIQAVEDLALVLSRTEEEGHYHKAIKQARQQASVSAAKAMVRWHDVAGLQHVLQVLPLDLMGCERLLDITKGQSDLLDVLWQHVHDEASSKGNGGLSVGFILVFCQVALIGGEEAAMSKIRQIIQGLKRTDWIQADVHAIASILNALSSKGLIDEILLIRRLAGSSFPSPPPTVLSRALLSCAALEGRPGRAIALLRKLGGHALPQDYEAVLQAMVVMRLPAPSMREKELVETPGNFLTWVMEGMGDKGPSPRAVQLALMILQRACEIGPVEHHRRETWIQRAVGLVNGLRANGHQADEVLCEALVKVSLWGLSLRQAIQVVEQMEGLKASPASLARVHGLLIAALAKRGEMMQAEEWLLRMVTLTGHGPTEGVMDAFAQSYVAIGNVSSGLSMLQGCFTQYGSRPSGQAFLGILDDCIVVKNDPYEAQRAVTIAQQLWGEKVGEGRGEVHPVLKEVMNRWKSFEEESSRASK